MPQASTRFTRRAALTAAFVLTAGSALAQGVPGKPVTLLVPYPAGGLSDVIARLVEKPLAKSTNQLVIVDNLGGAGGSIAAQKVLGAPADGQLVYQGSPNELILAPLAMQAVKYKSEDWRMVQIIGSFPMAVLARKGLEANTVDELVELAKKADAAGKPLTYGSVGIGSFYHVVGEHFAQTIGVKMTHVPYKGGAPMLQDMGGNLVDLAFFVVDSRLPGFVDKGMFKVLATMAQPGKPEARFLEKYPSINESKSVKDFAFDTWTGYFVRKDTPEAVVTALNKHLATAMADPEARKKLEDLGGRVPPMLSVADAQREYERQTARFRGIAKGIKLEAQ
ncbi:MAG: tripartite tricarboxylate transporter substrate binding protein [Rubrivivax sp.]|nr:tripartite tricarboxylate transporter substrate binding protein [Rubrivivax sp.]